MMVKSMTIFICFSIFSSLNSLFIHAAQKIPYQAVTIVPVADLVGQSLQEKSQRVTSMHHQLPLCGKKGDFACPRIHQALFNEIVTILAQQGDEVQLKISNYFFQSEHSDEKNTIFWSLKKNFMPLDLLKNHAINTSYFPPPINYQEPINYKKKVPQIITLVEPFKDQVTGLTFSAGTRFIKASEQPEASSINVYALDPKSISIKTISLPQQLTMQMNEVLSKKERIHLFVQLCRRWAHMSGGFIPYVWGGCSIINLCQSDFFEAKQSRDHMQNPIEYFYRLDAPKPHSGLDCAGLVARAAQTVGLPYFFKNTTTLAKHLQPIDQEIPIQNGDLIWFPGHVIIISNKAKNSIIEARHYSHGYGKVHELSLSNVFKGIDTFDQLKTAFITGRPLLRLDKNGLVVQTINQFKILQMRSVFDISF
jgi:hypothetical protein